MSNLDLVMQWHDNINQVEKTEAIVGGALGNAIKRYAVSRRLTDM